MVNDENAPVHQLQCVQGALISLFTSTIVEQLTFYCDPYFFFRFLIFLIIACMNKNCVFITVVHIQCIFYLVYVQTTIVCNYNVKV